MKQFIVTLLAVLIGGFLAMLAYDYAAAAELIRHGEYGLLAPPGDSDAFVRRAVDLAADAQLAQRLRCSARESTRSLDWMRICSQVESIWQHLVEQQLQSEGVIRPLVAGA